MEKEWQHRYTKIQEISTQTSLSLAQLLLSQENPESKSLVEFLPSRNDFTVLSVLSKSHFGSVELVQPARHFFSLRRLTTLSSSPKSTQTTPPQVYVLKSVLLDAGWNMRFQQSAIHELAVLRLSLTPLPDGSRPPIPTFYGSFLSPAPDGSFSLLISHAAGGDLYSLLQDTRYKARGGTMNELWMGDGLREGVVLHWMKELVDALIWLHSNGWAHRDLKPHNLLLTQTGRLLLTDFGSCAPILECYPPLSRSTSSTHTATTQTPNPYGIRREDARTLIGTPDYISPEVLRFAERVAEEDGDMSFGDDDLKELAYDERVDWWGIGACLYELVVGNSPFYARTIGLTYDLIVDCENSLKFPSGRLSPELQDLLSKLLCHPSSRLPLDKIKSHAWFSSTSYTPLVPPPYTPPLPDPSIPSPEKKIFDFSAFFASTPGLSVLHDNSSTLVDSSSSQLQAYGRIKEDMKNWWIQGSPIQLLSPTLFLTSSPPPISNPNSPASPQIDQYKTPAPPSRKTHSTPWSKDEELKMKSMERMGAWVEMQSRAWEIGKSAKKVRVDVRRREGEAERVNGTSDELEEKLERLELDRLRWVERVERLENRLNNF